jgi:hypothetical protein
VTLSWTLGGQGGERHLLGFLRRGGGLTAVARGLRCDAHCGICA